SAQDPFGYPAQTPPPGYPAAGPGMGAPWVTNPPPVPVPWGAPIPGREDPAKTLAKLQDKNPDPSKTSLNPLIMTVDGPNAFAECRNDVPDEGFYTSLGAVALQRNRLGHSGVAFLEPPSADPKNSTYPTGVQPEVLDYHNINPELGWGIQGSFGYRYDTE